MAIWTVKTYYKKNVQEVETYVQRKGEGKVTVTNGFRWGSWTVETSDDNPPEFEFTEVPGGDGKKDSIDMLDCCDNNIDNVELIDMDDGGCWYDIDVEGLDEDAEARARETYGSFEVEFAFEESQVVRFPLSMGVNGFAFNTNSVNYFNNTAGLFGSRRHYPNIYAVGD